MRISKLLDWAFDEARSGLVGFFLSLLFPGGVGVTTFIAYWDEFRKLPVSEQIGWLLAAPLILIVTSFVMALVLNELGAWWRRRSYIRAVELSNMITQICGDLLKTPYLSPAAVNVEQTHPVARILTMLMEYNPLWAYEFKSVISPLNDMPVAQAKKLQEFQERLSKSFGSIMQ